MRYLKYLAILIVIQSITACASYTTTRKHKDFSELFPRYKSVAIFAGDIVVVEEGRNGNKITMPSPEHLNSIKNIARNALLKKGYTVTAVIDNNNTASEDELKESYTKTVSDVYAKSERAKQEEAFITTDKRIAPVAADIAKKSGADMLMFLGYTGNEMSQGRINIKFAQDLALAFIGIQNETHIKNGTAIIGLIDGNTSQLLWTNLGKDYEDYDSSIVRLVTKKNIIETAFANALKDLPDKTIIK